MYLLIERNVTVLYLHTISLTSRKRPKCPPNKLASSVMAKPSLCLGLLGMRAKHDISLKKTFARFCDKHGTTHGTHTAATRRPRQEMAWPSKKHPLVIKVQRKIVCTFFFNMYRNQLSTYFGISISNQLRSFISSSWLVFT